MFTFSKKELMSIPYSRLLKLEVQNLAQEVVRVVEKHNPEELQLKPMHDLLVAKTPVIDELEVQYRGHPITKKLNRLRAERTVHVGAINFELKKVTRLDVTGNNDEVITLENAIKRFLDKLSESKNEKVMLQKLQQFVLQLEKDGVLSSAMRSLGFIVLLENLELVLVDTIGLLNARTASISTRPKVKTSLLKKTVVSSLTNMFEEIMLQQLKNPELDYGVLIDELNQTLKEFAVLINIRKANNEKKAEEKRLQEEGAGAVSPEQPDETDQDKTPDLYVASTNGYLQPNVEKANENGFNVVSDESLEQKKVAATPRKDVQLPGVSSDENHDS